MPEPPAPRMRVAEAEPFLPDQEQGSHRRRTEKKPDDAETLQAAEHTDEGPKEGQLDAVADQSGLHQIVAGQHHDRPEQAEADAGGDMALDDEQESGRAECG